MNKIGYTVIFIFLIGCLIVLFGYITSDNKKSSQQNQPSKSHRSIYIVKDVNDGFRKMLLKNPVIAAQVDSVINKSPYLRMKRQQFIREYYRKPVDGILLYRDMMYYQQMKIKRCK